MAKPCAHSALSPNLTRHLQPFGKGILVKSLVPRPDHQPCMSKCPLTSLSGCPVALPPQGNSAQAKPLIFPRPSQLPQPPGYRPAILAFRFLSKSQSIKQILLVVPSKHTQNLTTAHLLHCYLCGLHHHPRSSIFFLPQPPTGSPVHTLGPPAVYSQTAARSIQDQSVPITSVQNSPTSLRV